MIPESEITPGLYWAMETSRRYSSSGVVFQARQVLVRVSGRAPFLNTDIIDRDECVHSFDILPGLPQPYGILYLARAEFDFNPAQQYRAAQEALRPTESTP
jgi:hypothetical protein